MYVKGVSCRTPSCREQWDGLIHEHSTPSSDCSRNVLSGDAFETSSDPKNKASHHISTFCRFIRGDSVSVAISFDKSSFHAHS